MDWSLPGVLIFIVVIILLDHYIWKGGKKREKALSEWALSHHFSFRADLDNKMEERYPFKCLQYGKHLYAFNITEGSIGDWRTCAFDYNYQASSVKSTHDRYYSAIILDSGLPLKSLSIRNEKFLDKVGDSLCFDDIKFESIEFNKEFHVKSSDRRWAYDIVNQATMDLLLNSSRFNIEFNESCVIAYRDELFSVGHFEEALQLLTGILDNLPASVVQELKGTK